MICPSCKTKNQYYHRYCYYCGYKLDSFKSNFKIEKSEDKMQSEDESVYNQAQSPDTEALETPYPEIYSEDLEDLYVTLKNEDIENDIESDTENYADSDIKSDIEDSIEDDIEHTEEKIGFDLVSGSEQSIYDYLFEPDKIDDFDITREIPLRRYRKDRTSRSRNKLSRILTFTFVVFLFAATTFILIKVIESSPSARQAINAQTIVVSTVVKPTEKDGKPAHQIIFNTTNGKEVKILDTIIPVKDGRAELVLEDSFLYTLNPIENEDGLLELELESTISAPGFKDVNEVVTIVLNPTQLFAPLTLIQPSTNEAVVEGESFQLVLSVDLGSKVFINDNDYTDLINEDGKLVRNINLPLESDETYITVKVSREGYIDNVQEIVLKRPVMEVPIMLDEPSPIPSKGQWAKISGTTLPGASITVDKQIREEPVVDPETGKFTLYVRASYPGYNPCTLTATLNDKSSSIEVILDGETNVDIYTSTAWKPEYIKMQLDPNLHNGQHFLFRGTIQDILLIGYKNVFTVDVSADANSPQLIQVEYWGDDFDWNQGDKIRVFGNRWGNVNDIPRILAKYIYNN